MNILYGLIGLGIAYVIVKYRGQIGDMMGRVDWAENFLGSTYNLVALVGVGVAIFSLLGIFGMLDFGNGQLQIEGEI